MKKFNSSWVRFDVEDLKSQIETHVALMRDLKDKKYSIDKAMSKIGLSKSWYFSMLERGTIRTASMKKLSKLKIWENNINVKTL
jgi:hypothetical protein